MLIWMLHESVSAGRTTKPGDCAIAAVTPHVRPKVKYLARDAHSLLVVLLTLITCISSLYSLFKLGGLPLP